MSKNRQDLGERLIIALVTIPLVIIIIGALYMGAFMVTKSLYCNIVYGNSFCWKD